MGWGLEDATNHGLCHMPLNELKALRGVGGNGWRMSHNPYRDTLYDTMDRLGVMVWDETRDLRQPQLPAFGQMVRCAF